MNYRSEQFSSAPPAGTGAAMDRRVEVSKWRKRRPFVFGAIGLCTILGLAIWLVPKPGTAVVDHTELRMGAAQSSVFEDFLPVRATIEPLRSVYVDAVEGGRVEQLLVEDGTVVAAGQIIATLANPQFEIQVASQEAAIAGQLGNIAAQQLALQQQRLNQQNSLSEARYNLLQADRDLEIKRHLHILQFESDAALQAAGAQADYYRQQVQTSTQASRRAAVLADVQARELQDARSRLTENLRAIRASLGSLDVRAPVAGRLTALDLQIGQSVTAGNRLAQIDSEQDYKLVASIDEFYLGRVATGQSVKLGAGSTSQTLSVTRILPQVTDGKFEIEMAFADEAPADVRRGQTLDARITLGRSETALLVPSGAWLEATGGNWVFVVDDAGKAAQRRTIVTGRRNPSQVEVLEGLQPGDRIVISSYANFQDRSRLVIR